MLQSQVIVFQGYCKERRNCDYSEKKDGFQVLEQASGKVL
jgi:hypothetical protein